MITSVQNEKIKKWKKLLKRKGRLETNTFLVEGFHLLEEAWKSKWEIEDIIVQEDVSLPNWCQEYKVTTVSNNVLQALSQTKSPQGVVAVIRMQTNQTVTGPHIVLIDAIQDPGNLGTIIRTADAAGFNGVILGHDTVDIYNSKVIRATQGSIFHIPVFYTNLLDQIQDLKHKGYQIWATALKDAQAYQEVSVGEKVAILVGNEGNGVHSSLIDAATVNVNIPIYGEAESLNVSIAAGILIYHVKQSSLQLP
ncbi:TrmH family RNA methyltransferase [Oceanobacillus halotolerans]|uniref:TrmH family RNA methyltransferase n=1 Tax=Oceanobacillus halotolerans TaxID=2663380 RepID=UPI0013DA97DA|nr:RNA methyltransferase [Oceanobacillus halotolerans]